MTLLDLAINSRRPVVDAQGFADLYKTYTAAVFNYCLFRVGDRVAAEDLTADTFERAWRARHRYQAEQAQFSTWLFIIARRTVTDWQRRQARRPLIKLKPSHPAADSSPETAVEESEQQTQLRRLIGRLEPQEQELIALKFGAGMTNRDIAPLIGKSETAVGSALYRLMQKLRSQWNEIN